MLPLDYVLPDATRILEWAYKIKTDKVIKVNGGRRSEVRRYVRQLAPGLHGLLLLHMLGEYLHLKPPPWTPFEKAELPSIDPAVLEKHPELADLLETQQSYLNSRYQVDARELSGGLVHLSIKKLGKEPHIDWRDMQRIKNELCGPEREAVEIYPAESRLVYTCNQYHLFVLPEGERLPIGFNERMVMSPSDLEADDVADAAVQRPFEE